MGIGRYGQGLETGVRDLVPAAFEVDQRLGPEETQHLDLLLDPLATIVEIHAESLVFDVVPAEAHAQTEATTR